MSVDSKLPLKSESDQNRRSKSAGLKSESLTIRIGIPYRNSLNCSNLIKRSPEAIGDFPTGDRSHFGRKSGIQKQVRKLPGNGQKAAWCIKSKTFWDV